MRVGSLFSGIGLLELGLEWGLGEAETVWQVERDEGARSVLERWWPKADRSVTDVREANRTNLKPVELICGGFPCPDLSSAGRGLGLAGARSGLWFEFARIVGEMRPEWVVVENVASGAARYVPHVRHDLRALGYRSAALGISAADVGAPHRRERIFLVAHLDSERRERERLAVQGEGTTGHTGYTLTDVLVRGLWPTATATPYGSTNNGSPHDGRESYATKGTPSLDTLARREGGSLNPAWVEALMGAPIGWTDGLPGPDANRPRGSRRGS